MFTTTVYLNFSYKISSQEDRHTESRFSIPFRQPDGYNDRPCLGYSPLQANEHTKLYSKPPNLAKSNLAKSVLSDCLEKTQTLKFGDFHSYLAKVASNVPRRYPVPPPARSEPSACLFICDVSPIMPPAFPLDNRAIVRVNPA